MNNNLSKSYLDQFSLPRRMPDADEFHPLRSRMTVIVIIAELPLLFDFGKNVRLAEQVVLLAVSQVNLGATVFGQQDLLADADRQWNVLAGLTIAGTGTDGHDRTLQHLGLGLLRQHDAALGFREGFGAKDQHTVQQGNQTLGGHFEQELEIIFYEHRTFGTGK